MKTFYFEDENGTYFSPKKTRRFKKLSGIEAYDYLNEEAQKGIKHRFLRFVYPAPKTADARGLNRTLAARGTAPPPLI